MTRLIMTWRTSENESRWPHCATVIYMATNPAVFERLCLRGFGGRIGLVPLTPGLMPHRPCLLLSLQMMQHKLFSRTKKDRSIAIATVWKTYRKPKLILSGERAASADNDQEELV